MATEHSIGIAGIKVVRHPDRIRTTLGSCIGIAIYDRVARIGGLAHVMLPDSKSGQGDPGKFADTGVDLLVNELIGQGANRQRMAAKIGGGAAMFGRNNDNGLGARNAEAVRERLKRHAIRLAGEDVGGEKGRRMSLDPGTGDVIVQCIGCEPVTI